jgi:predicted nucleotidyltransferase
MTEHTSSSISLPDEFLSRLVAELNNETVRAIILHGSYARGDAMPPYSDVDLVRILYETPERKLQKRFVWYDGYLLNLSSRPLSLYREWLTIPQEAIFRVSTIWGAHILLEKDSAFRAFQQETLNNWKWEPLQAAADEYASQLLEEQTEIVFKILKALKSHDSVALSEMILDLFSAVTEAVAVQHGVLVSSGNTYFHQVQEAVGRNSLWTSYHLRTAGIVPRISSAPSIEERGRAALHLYQETVQLLQSHLLPQYWETIAPLLDMIEHALSNEEVL